MNDRANEAVEGPAKGRADTSRLVSDTMAHIFRFRARLTPGDLCAPSSRYERALYSCPKHCRGRYGWCMCIALLFHRWLIDLKSWDTIPDNSVCGIFYRRSRHRQVGSSIQDYQIRMHASTVSQVSNSRGYQVSRKALSTEPATNIMADPDVMPYERRPPTSQRALLVRPSHCLSGRGSSL